MCNEIQCNGNRPKPLQCPDCGKEMRAEGYDVDTTRVTWVCACGKDVLGVTRAEWLAEGKRPEPLSYHEIGLIMKGAAHYLANRYAANDRATRDAKNILRLAATVAERDAEIKELKAALRREINSMEGHV